MSEKELNSYRFLSGEEPSDEMLSCIMHEVAEKARLRFEGVESRYAARSRQMALEKKAIWASRIADALRNG